MPIKPGAVKSELIDLCIKSSDLWEHFRQCRLTQNVRLEPGQERFRLWQMRVGDGDDLQGDEGEITVPDECHYAGDLVDEIYKRMIDGDLPQSEVIDYVKDRCILAVMNDTVKLYNNEVTRRMPGELGTFASVNRTIPDAENYAQQIPVETLDAYDPPELPPHLLQLKQNSLIILLRNLDVKRSLCNGTR